MQNQKSQRALNHVEQYSKTDENKWIFSEYEEENSILTLSSIQFQIPLSDIYDKVDFEAKE
jgi:Uma2 family endonuclease